MRVDWLQRELRTRQCPVCGLEGAKAAVLTTDHVLPGSPPITLLRCAGCGAAFLVDLTPPDYGAETPEMLQYYVEQGAGIDLVVMPLMRVPPASVRRYLEIGCSYPFALDFSRFSFGWKVIGVDPSPLAVRGAADLDVPVMHSYFDDDLDLVSEPFDLVFCSEILEHVADPHALLESIRARLSPEGLLVLTTPNLEIVHEGTKEGMLTRALSPGFHLILYDERSLAQALSQAGFTSILIEASPETLRAFAAASPEPLARLLPRDQVAERSLLLEYYGERTKQVAPSSVVASGLAYRHFKECVNAGLYEEAAKSRQTLANVYRERYGFDLEEPSSLALATSLPFNLSNALFFSGMLELNGLQRPGRAAECFASAIAAGQEIQRSACPFSLFDGETEMLLRQSRKHLPMALAATDPDAAVREVELLDRAKLPGELLDETVVQTFVRLVNAGAYSAAERLAARVAMLIEVQPPEEFAHSLDPLYCLAMLALQSGRAGEAAQLFRRVSLAAESSGAEILQAARYHELLSREQADLH